MHRKSRTAQFAAPVTCFAFLEESETGMQTDVRGCRRPLEIETKCARREQRLGVKKIARETSAAGSRDGYSYIACRIVALMIYI